MSAQKAAAEHTIRFSLICEAPPTSPGIDFGIQDKFGALAPGKPEPDGSLRFDGEMRAVIIGDGTVRLRGSLVHGPPNGRFLYLSCRAAGRSNSPWLFRLKVPLVAIDGGATWVWARIRGSKGGTVPLLGSGWTSVVEG
jgi:hypothetical protein